MSSTVRYASGGAAAGSLRQLCTGRPGDCVVELLDPLAFGPLRDVDQPAGLQQREHYLRQLFERILAVDRFDEPAAGTGLPEFVTARPDAARALVWCDPRGDL